MGNSHTCTAITITTIQKVSSCRWTWKHNPMNVWYKITLAMNWNWTNCFNNERIWMIVLIGVHTHCQMDESTHFAHPIQVDRELRFHTQFWRIIPWKQKFGNEFISFDKVSFGGTRELDYWNCRYVEFTAQKSVFLLEQSLRHNQRMLKSSR